VYLHSHINTVREISYIVAPALRKVMKVNDNRNAPNLETYKRVEIFRGVFANYETDVDYTEKSYEPAEVTFSRYLGEGGEWRIPEYSRLTIKACFVMITLAEGVEFSLEQLHSILSFDGELTLQERLGLRLPTHNLSRGVGSSSKALCARDLLGKLAGW